MATDKIQKYNKEIFEVYPDADKKILLDIALRHNVSCIMEDNKIYLVDKSEETFHKEQLTTI